VGRNREIASGPYNLPLFPISRAHGAPRASPENPNEDRASEVWPDSAMKIDETMRRPPAQAGGAGSTGYSVARYEFQELAMTIGPSRASCG